MKKFLTSNDTLFRLLRTVVQGILGIIVANIDIIIGKWDFDPDIKTMVVAVVMCILSPVMAEIGKGETSE